MIKMRGSLVMALCMVGMSAVAASGEGCKPAEVAPKLSQVEQTVLDDLAMGKSAEEIERDVAQDLAGQPGADATKLVQDAIALLEDLGVIPPNVLGHAQDVARAEKMKIEARPK